MGSNSLLTNRNLRREMIQRINKLIDIPYLNEKHEGHLITIVVDMCFNALAGKSMPSSSKQRGIDIENTETEDHEEVQSVEIPEGDEATVKEKLIADINNKLNIPILNEKQEAALIKHFVDVLYDVKHKDNL